MGFGTCFVAASVSFLVNRDKSWPVRPAIIFSRNSTVSTW